MVNPPAISDVSQIQVYRSGHAAIPDRVVFLFSRSL